MVAPPTIRGLIGGDRKGVGKNGLSCPDGECPDSSCDNAGYWGEYWTCGQGHDHRNLNWKPWQHLERLCRKLDLDDFAVREILVEHLGRKLECECQVLYDERELWKEALKRQFGVDLGSWEIGLVD